MYVKRIDLAKLFIGLNPLSFFPVLNQCHVFIFSISIPDLCEEIDNCCKLNSHPENSRILKLGGEGGGRGRLETGPRKYYLRKWRSSMPAGQRRAPLQQFCLAERRERERRAHSGTAICVSPLAIPGAPGYRDGGATFGKRERPLLGNLQRRMVHKLKGARAANFINRERGSHSLRSLFSPSLCFFHHTFDNVRYRSRVNRRSVAVFKFYFYLGFRFRETCFWDKVPSSQVSSSRLYFLIFFISRSVTMLFKFKSIDRSFMYR